MGRQQYLIRLALGRSAFEASDENTETSTPSVQVRDDNTGYVQQYNAKGRATNPAIEKFNADLRDAQNDVLSLVGVVERKDQTERLDELKTRYLRERRQEVLAEEQERGELLDYATTPVVFLFKSWPSAFLQRIQIGYYEPSRSVSEIVLSEWRDMWTTGGDIKLSLATLFPAFGKTIVHFAVRIPLILGAEQIAGRLQSLVGQRKLKRKTVNRLYNGISIFFEALMVSIDLTLLPMDFYGTAQRLGLAPQLPLFPSIKSFWPWSPDCFHNYGFSPLISTSIIRKIASPGALMMTDSLFHYDTDDDETPILALFTPYRYPPVVEEHTNELYLQDRPKLSSDPIGWLLEKQFSLRHSILRLCGWSLVSTEWPTPRHHDGKFITDVVDSQDQPWKPRPLHRSTHLAHLPAVFLARLIDKFLCRLIMLPFESLMLRTVATTFLAQSSTGSSALSHLYAPFGGGPLAQCFKFPTSPSAWSALASYTSRLGLALALNASIDTFLFFAVYRSTRRIGISCFDWGSKGHIGFSEVITIRSSTGGGEGEGQTSSRHE